MSQQACNSLPESLRTITCTAAAFKRHLKTLFLTFFFIPAVSTSDSFSTMALYKSIYLLTYLICCLYCIDFCIARPIRSVVGLTLNIYDDDDDDGILY